MVNETSYGLSRRLSIRCEEAVTRCGDSDCSSCNVIVAADTEPLVGEYSSLQLDREGNPVVSYLGRRCCLKLFRCGEPTCIRLPANSD